jgi:hypothetical protein
MLSPQERERMWHVALAQLAQLRREALYGPDALGGVIIYGIGRFVGGKQVWPAE